MIHNLQVVSNIDASDLKKSYSILYFDVITQVGKAKCKVIIGNDHWVLETLDLPQCYVEGYEVLGQSYDFPHSEEVHSLFSEGILRLSDSVLEVCEANNWHLTKY
jgi:hypothetical protein